jgi:hypothetical protein
MQPYDPDIWPQPPSPEPEVYPMPNDQPGFYPEPMMPDDQQIYPVPIADPGLFPPPE